MNKLSYVLNQFIQYLYTKLRPNPKLCIKITNIHPYLQILDT